MQTEAAVSPVLVDDAHPFRRAWERLERVGIGACFLLLAVPMGLFLTFAIPPGQGLDEPNHFYRVLTISQGSLVAIDVNGRVGGYIPNCARAYLTVFMNRAGQIGPYQKHELFQQPSGCDARAATFIPFENTASYPPISYLPQTLAVGVTRLLGAPAPVVFYSGRLAALAAYLALIFLAIQITPLGRSVFFLLGVWPMSLIQASTYTADTLTIVLGALLVACVLRCLDEGQRIPEGVVRSRIFALACVAAAALSLAKIVYIVLAPLLLLVPERQFPNRAISIGIKVGVLLIIGLTGAIWFFLVKDISQAAWFPPGQIDPHQRLAEIIHRPSWYAAFMVSALFNQPISYFTWQSFVAQVSFFRNPARGPALPPPWVMMCGYFMLLLAYLRDSARTFAWTISSAMRAALPIVLMSATIALTFTAIYVQSTASAVVPIVGGRYLLPLFTVPLISLCALAAGRFQRLPVLPFIPFIFAMYMWLGARVFALFYAA
jgi:uncharacterized membrane protein